MKCVPACVLTPNAGVPCSNVRVSVSPAATADTTGGAVLIRESGPIQEAEAALLLVHAKGERLGVSVGVGVACELPPPDEPHAASSITIVTISIATLRLNAAAGCPTHTFLSLIHISEPTRLGMISYAVFCLKK